MAPFNRGTGLLVIEVRASNPNGDPDQESEPRTLSTDGRGLISPVSFKRKVRDLVAEQDGAVWGEAAAALRLGEDGDPNAYQILETRGRDRDEIKRMSRDEFMRTFWDARVFGNTFLEEMDAREREGKDHFIRTGTVQFGPGISLAPVEIERMTNTNKAGVEQGKDRGMAPLAFRVVQHGVYVMPFFVNPMMAQKSGCAARDIDLLKFLIPHAYTQTASAIRPFVSVVHAWYAEHRTPLGSCPDYLIIDALTPKKREAADQPSSSLAEYEIPVTLPEELYGRVSAVHDLCAMAYA